MIDGRTIFFIILPSIVLSGICRFLWGVVEREIRMSKLQTHLEPEGASPGESKDIVVFMVRRETKCAECGKDLSDGNLLRMENNRPHCLDCADLGHLEFRTS